MTESKSGYVTPAKRRLPVCRRPVGEHDISCNCGRDGYIRPLGRTQHRHLPRPEDVVAQAIRVADGSHSLGAGALGEVAIKALREAGYYLMQSCCEACDDDGNSW